MLRFTNVDHQPTELTPIYAYRTYPLLPLRQALEPLLSEIDQLDEFIEIAKAACHHPSEHNLTRDESASIFMYTMDWGEQSLYRVLNKKLRVKDRFVLVPWHGYLKLFETALKKLPSLEHSLWRGVSANINQNYKEGVELTWWSYSSCSSGLNVVRQFLGPVSTLFMINAKNAKDISLYSNIPEEKEVILGLGTRLRVVSDALAHPSLNVVHLIELSGENLETTADNRPMVKTSSILKDRSDTNVNNRLVNHSVDNQSHGGRYEISSSQMSSHDLQ